jgi:hypothetical protein
MVLYCNSLGTSQSAVELIGKRYNVALEKAREEENERRNR